MWEKLGQQIWQWRVVIATAPSIAGLVMLLRFTGGLQPLEWWAFDQLLCLRPREALDSRIVVVEIQESDLKKVKKWPLPDAVLANLLNKLKQQQPKAIGLDLYRDLPVEPGYQTLAKVFETTPNLIGISKVVGDEKGAAIDPPPVLDKLGQIGANDTVVDSDGKVRRGLLYVTPPSGDNVLSLALTLSMFYLQDQDIQLEVTDDQQLRFEKTTLPAFAANDGGYVRADDRSYQILLNYRGTQQSFHRVSMTEVLENRIPPDLLRDRIVLVGAVAESLKDLFYWPQSSDLRETSPELIPGVYIHANLTSQILSTVLDDRALMKTWDKPLELLWIFVWAGVGTALSWALRFGGATRWSSRGFIRGVCRRLALPLTAGGLIGAAYIAFLSGWWIPLVPGLMALVGSTLAVTTHLAGSADRIRKTFGRYLTEEVVTALLEHPRGLQLGGERRKITILTSDLRGFTAISERLSAEEVVKVINLYLEHMANVITQYQGTIDEFMGDGILVLFGAPIAREDDAERAIACAVAMQLAMVAVNQEMQKQGLPHLEMGIGINTGEVVVGNIGSEKRTKYGIVGNQVNLTYRIESFTVGGQIIMSESTLQEVGAIVKTARQHQVQPKGLEQPLTVYEIIGIEGQHHLFLPESSHTLQTLKQFLPFRYKLLDGKQVVGEWASGQLTKLSSKEAELVLEQPVPLMSNLKLQLSTEASVPEASGDIYVKVITQDTKDVNQVCICFTAVPPAIEVMFSHLLSSSPQSKSSTP